MEMGERIREIRKEKNMSQAELADLLGVTRSVISNIELNRLANPEQKIPLVKLLAKEFSLNEQWLLTGEGDKNAASNTENLASLLVDIKTGRKPFAAKYIDFLASLTDAEWEIFEKQTKIMKRFYEEIDEAECEDM